MIFNDEFTGSQLNAAKWTTCFWWGCSTRAIPTLTYLPENVILQDGILRLRAQEGAFSASGGGTVPHSSGIIASSGTGSPSSSKFMFRYGYAEARVKVPKGKGLWPAFWMLEPKPQNPLEIDIMEILTSEVHTTFQHHMYFHYTDQSGNSQDSGAIWNSPQDLADGFHVFAVSWEPDAIRWYVDGIERRTAFTNTAYIPNVDMYLLLNLQVGGEWPGPPDETTPFPSYYDVDYVRVWKRL